MKKKVTIYDIAEATGMNITAVSRAFSRDGKISSEKREIILEAAERLGYKPNRAAVNLSRKEVKIGVLIVRFIPEYADVMINTFTSINSRTDAYKIFCDVRAVEAENNCDETYVALLDEFLREKYDGVIISVLKLGQRVSDKVDELYAAGIPTATVTADLPRSKRLFFVGNNTVVAGRMAAEYLTAHTGTGNIAVFSGDMSSALHGGLVGSFCEEVERRGGRITRVFDTKDMPSLAYSHAAEAFENSNDLAGVYVSSANSIPVIRQAVAAGIAGKIRIMTSDIFAELYGYIEDGTVCGTIYQDPVGQVELSVSKLYQYITQNKPTREKYMIVPQLIMRSNLALYRKKPQGRYLPRDTGNSIG